MASTKYTGVSKDKSTGKYMYYFKAGVDLATGKPYQERRRGYDTAKEAFEARTQAMNKVHKKGTLKHTQMNFEQFLEIIFKPNFYASTRQGIEDKNEVIFRELVKFFGKKKPRAITPVDVTMYKKYVVENYANSYAKRKMGLLNQILRSAKDHGLIFGDVPTEKVRTFEKDLIEALKNNSEILTEIREKKELDDEMKSRLDEFIKNFKKEYVW